MERLKENSKVVGWPTINNKLKDAVHYLNVLVMTEMIILNF